MGSPCLHVSGLLKWGLFTGCALKLRITLIQSEVLVTRKIQRFYLESKASFIDKRSIASFKLFLVACLWEYCTFSDSSVVSLKSWPWPKYIQQGTIFQKKIMFYYQTFFLLPIRPLLDCSQQIREKKIGGHRARLREKEIKESLVKLMQESYLLCYRFNF